MRNLFIILIFHLASISVLAQVKINEIHSPCPNSESCYKKTTNWIELYNSGRSFEKGSLFFTDDISELKKWPVYKMRSNSHYLRPKKYYLITINPKGQTSKAKVEISTHSMDSLYLVLMVKTELKIVSRVPWPKLSQVNNEYSSGEIDQEWQQNKLYPSPNYINFVPENSAPLKRMNLYLSPIGITGLGIDKGAGQKNKAVTSYGFGVYRATKALRVIDFQYGLSMYRIGYLATFVATDVVGTTTRERTTIGESSGWRVAIDYKLGLPIHKKLKLYGGLETALVNRSNLALKTNIKITTKDGTVKNSVLETNSISATGMNYFLGLFYELEYCWKHNLSFSSKHILVNDISSDVNKINTTQWNFMLGVNWRFWSSKRKVEDFSLL